MSIAFSYSNRLRLGQAKGGLAFKWFVIARSVNCDEAISRTRLGIALPGALKSC